MQIAEMSEKINKLGSAWEEFKYLNDKRLNDLEKKKNFDPLDLEQLGKINNFLDECKSRMDVIETSLNRPLFSSEKNYSIADNEHKKAFSNYVRKGYVNNLHEIERKALSVQSDPDGGFLVPRPVSNKIAELINEISPIRKLASIEHISSDSLDIIEDFDHAGSGWTSEIAQVNETNTPQINKKRINVYELYAQPKATQKLIDDASIDIEKWLTKKLTESFALAENQAFINGDGKGKPKGILSYGNGKTTNSIEQIETANKITSDSLFILFYSLKEKYAAKASFLMNRHTLQSIRMLKEDGTGQYLWNPGLIAGTPDTLLGVPVYQAAEMPIIATQALPIAVGDFSSAYRIVDRSGIRVLRDPFTEKPFVKFYATKRVGGDIVNSEAIKLLKIAK